MSDLTNYYENRILSHSFDGASLAAIPSVYVALHTENPTETGDQGEVTAASYDRVEVDTTSGFTIDGSNAENAAEINFGTAAESWGNITHFSIWDAASGGNPLWYSALEEAKQIDANDGLRFGAGLITATID